VNLIRILPARAEQPAGPGWSAGCLTRRANEPNKTKVASTATKGSREIISFDFYQSCISAMKRFYTSWGQHLLKFYFL